MERKLFDKVTDKVHSLLVLLQIETLYTAYLLQNQDLERGMLSWEEIPAGSVVARAEVRSGIRKDQLIQVEINLNSSFGAMTIPEALEKIKTGFPESETNSTRIIFSDNVPNASFQASRRNARA